MPSRRQIREAVIQFLYCADLEGGADPALLKPTFWEFVTESDRRSLQVATFRTVNHLAQTRHTRMEEFLDRQPTALVALAAWPEAESLKLELARIASLESSWSTALAALQRIPKDDEDASVADRIKSALNLFFRTDRDLSSARSRFLQEIDDFPALRTSLEPIAATLRRLQRISERLRMIEEPEHFPDQPDLQKLRQSKSEIEDLRREADALTDGVLLQKAEIDRALAAIVENFAPERIDPVDRAILRLATHEILHLGVPRKAAINEAIELAKRFGTSDSGRFVNGILDQIKRPESPPSADSTSL